MIAIPVEQRLLILRQPEVVALFLQALDLRSAGRTLVVHELGLGDEELVHAAVPALVLAFVDVAGLLNAIPDLLRRRVVARLSGADEVVVRDRQVHAHLPEVARDHVGEHLRFSAGLLRRARDFLPVLVGAGQEEHVLPHQTAATCAIASASIVV